VPPVVSDLSGAQAPNTIPAADDAPPVFTPNGDKLSERFTYKYRLSESASVTLTVRRADDESVVRTSRATVKAGARKGVWDGKGDDGSVVSDGRYLLELTPKDQAGNVGETVRTAVRILTAIRSPKALPNLFYGADGDALAPVSSLVVTLTKPAAVTWRIVDPSGNLVRQGPRDEPLPAGQTSWEWDGLDDAGKPVADGTYVSMITASTENGTYSHKVKVQHAPFVVTMKPTVSVGQSQVLTVLTAEPVIGWPRIEVRQPGVNPYTLYPTRYSTTKFTARWTVRPGQSGPVTLVVTTTDADGGEQTREYTATIG
jgi:flagellar hook assembly protein FlgD